MALAAGPALAKSAADYRFEAIEGGTIELAELAGGPVLVVNTASRCGFVGQYDGLQALHERYRDRGLTVIGVPSDSFRQELGDEAAVKEFCEVNFAIDFPMTEITPVVGEEAHPFYEWAREEGAAPLWNFHKILLDGEGRIAGSFGTTVEPDAPELTAAIEELLPGE
jgi:glutathione peroxidase